MIQLYAARGDTVWIQRYDRLKAKGWRRFQAKANTGKLKVPTLILEKTDLEARVLSEIKGDT